MTEKQTPRIPTTGFNEFQEQFLGRIASAFGLIYEQMSAPYRNLPDSYAEVTFRHEHFHREDGEFDLMRKRVSTFADNAFRRDSWAKVPGYWQLFVNMRLGYNPQLLLEDHSG